MWPGQEQLRKERQEIKVHPSFNSQGVSDNRGSGGGWTAANWSSLPLGLFYPENDQEQRSAYL